MIAGKFQIHMLDELFFNFYMASYGKAELWGMWTAIVENMWVDARVEV